MRQTHPDYSGNGVLVHEQLPITNVEDLLSKLTIEEKVSLLAGADEWQTNAIERLGIGSLKVTDGPAGARGRLMVDGPKAAFLPAPILQAATWCKSDLKAVGELLCKETKTKAAHILAGPTVCCVRNPLGGRNFETFSEDPFLSGSLASVYVEGLQQTGEVAAAAKHFVANEQEKDRFTMDTIIDEQTLREIYLRPFEIMMKSASPPRCVMTAYNLVNGVHMDSNADIIRKTLREEWKFDVLIMSDWGGTNSTVESVIAGCDLEMPGPPVRRGRKLLESVAGSSRDELLRAIDDSCRRIMSLAKDMNLLGLSASQVKATRNQPERSATSKEDLQRLRRTVANGHVLLKNDAGALPLKLGGPRKRVAFVGPNARQGTSGGGGSASMNPQYQSHPLQAFENLVAELGMDVEMHNAQGAYSNKWLPIASSHQWSACGAPSPSEAMFKVEFFADAELSGQVIESQYRNKSSIDLTDSGPFSLREAGKPYSVRVRSWLTPDTTGYHHFSLASVGHSRLIVNGNVILNNYDWTRPGEAFYAFSSAEVLASMKMFEGEIYEVIVEGATKTHQAVNTDNAAHIWSIQPSIRLGYLEQLPDNIVSEAVELGNACDYTVVVIGLSDEWESEGYDRETLALPRNQNELVGSLLRHTLHPENVIIVNQSGSPVEMPWAVNAHTILQAWYGGQEAGNALADVLLGVVSPSGRLPITWPKQYADLDFSRLQSSWPGVDGQVQYTEGTDVGYRWYTKHNVEPQWWFGHGLSYTTFSIRQVTAADQEHFVEVTVEIENTGSASGSHVVQMYSWVKGDSTKKELRAFDKTCILAPGEKEVLQLRIGKRGMAHWGHGCWVLETGEYLLGMGDSAGDVGTVVAAVTIAARLTWAP